jgi:cytoskeleton protein RodZ
MPLVGGIPNPAPIVAEQAPVAGAEGDSSDSNTVEPIEPEPSINEAQPRAPESGAAEGALVSVEPAPVVARPEQPVGDQEIEASVRSAADILAALEPVAATGAEPQIYRTDDARTRVILRARDNAWVHVSSTNNDYLWVKTLQPGDAFVVPDRPDLVLWTGNAGGIEVIVDGAPLPPLGPDAGVVRDVSLQPRALLRRLLPVPAAAPSL